MQEYPSGDVGLEVYRAGNVNWRVACLEFKILKKDELSKEK